MKSPAAKVSVRQALDKRVELKYEELPLDQVAKDLHEKLDIPVHVDRKALTDVSIGDDTPVTFAVANVSAKSAIRMMLRDLGLTTVIRDEVLWITTPEEAESKLETRVFDVADLVCRDDASDKDRPDFQQLIDAIRTCLRPVSWDSVGGPGSIVPFHAVGINAVVVSQPEDCYEEIEALLAQLRAIRRAQPKGSKGAVASGTKPRGPESARRAATFELRPLPITEAEAAVRQALRKPISFQFKETPLNEVVATLKKKIGLPIVVGVDRLGLITAEAKDVTLESALDQILGPVDLTWTYDRECLLITTVEREKELLVTRSYDVSDLPSFRDKKGRGIPDYDAISDMITGSIAPTTWEDADAPGSIAAIDVAGVQGIVVIQSWKTHRKIESLLAHLRQLRGGASAPKDIAKLPLAPEHADAQSDNAPRKPPEVDPRRDAIIEANNRFAFDLYKRLREKSGSQSHGNLFFSPCGISTGLAMVYAGARGQTAEEMAKTLHFAMPQADMAAAFQSLLATFPAANQRGCLLTTANRLWGQKGYGFRDAFLAITRNGFGAELAEVDFARPDAVCRAINAWADEKTAGQIKQIVGPDTINDRLRFVLTNAVYFKGEWAEKFKKARTQAGPFHIGDEKVDVPMMHQVAACRYGVVDNIQILEKAYCGGKIAMMILLPGKEPGAMAALEGLLSAEKVKQWSRSSLTEFKVKVEVYLPRFKVETDFAINDLLPSMGMSRVFQADQADLSGINGGREPLWLGSALHRAVVEVDEEGTKAAAVTAGMGAFGGPLIFRADRPFIFLIRDTRTGAILFLGRLMKPEYEPRSNGTAGPGYF
jgi:serpin B